MSSDYILYSDASGSIYRVNQDGNGGANLTLPDTAFSYYQVPEDPEHLYLLSDNTRDIYRLNLMTLEIDPLTTVGDILRFEFHDDDYLYAVGSGSLYRVLLNDTYVFPQLTGLTQSIQSPLLEKEAIEL
jgi:hypothetical protein